MSPAQGMRPPLTPSQEQFLRLLLELYREAGVPPTVREIQARGRFKSPRSVTQFLDALEGAGIIERGEGARNIRITRSPLSAKDENTETVQVPVVGSVAAGTPILAVQNVEDHVTVSARIAKPPHRYFFLRVRGDSMNRAGIKDGMLALVRQQQTARTGDNVVALIDEDATIKRLQLLEDMAILEPMSSNPKHKPIVVHRDLVVQGIVVTAMPDITRNR